MLSQEILKPAPFQGARNAIKFNIGSLKFLYKFYITKITKITQLQKH